MRPAVGAAPTLSRDGAHDMPGIRTRPLTPTIGALVENVDLSLPLNE